MNRKTIVKLAISAAVVASPGLGLTEMSASAASGSKSAEAQAKKAFGWAQKSEKQYAKGNIDKALSFAEAAVAGDMQNHEYRALLARIYMKQGRFVAAERTLMDVMDLGQTDPRTVVSLALARTAQGKVDSAIALVDANRSILPASDYGLALALAGDSKRAVDVLVDAIRSNNATARTRQNLALAYALDGRWREAQVMAVQDMPKTMADKRIVEWAQYSRPGAYEVRVAGLLGVTPRADSGQPVALALNAPTNDVQMAAVEAAVETPLAVATSAPVAELAAVGPAPIEFVPGDGTAVVEQAVAVAVAAMPAAVPAVEEPAPVDVAVAGPIEFVPGTGIFVVEQAVAVAVAALPGAATVPAVEAPLIKAPEAPAKAPVKLALVDTAPAAAKSMSGTHLVQLGAFSSKANAQAAWSQYVRKYGVLQGFDSASSSVTVNGKWLVRLAAMGFGNKAAADAACRSIRAGGGDCIVRSTGGEKPPVRMAARKPVKVASR